MAVGVPVINVGYTSLVHECTVVVLGSTLTVLLFKPNTVVIPWTESLLIFTNEKYYSLFDSKGQHPVRSTIILDQAVLLHVHVVALCAFPHLRHV